jgi:hypothetical protein
MLVPGLYPILGCPGHGYGSTEKSGWREGALQRPQQRTYFIRVYHNGSDTFQSLETTRIKTAIERLDARRAAKAAARLGLTLEPDSPERAII